MQITLYRRSYPAADAPVSLSLVPDHAEQHHTFTVLGREYAAERREICVDVPDGARLDVLRNRLCWAGTGGSVKSTAREVFDLAEALAPGFRMA